MSFSRGCLCNWMGTALFWAVTNPVQRVTSRAGLCSVLWGGVTPFFSLHLQENSHLPSVISNEPLVYRGFSSGQLRLSCWDSAYNNWNLCHRMAILWPLQSKLMVPIPFSADCCELTWPLLSLFHPIIFLCKTSFFPLPYLSLLPGILLFIFSMKQSKTTQGSNYNTINVKY